MRERLNEQGVSGAKVSYKHVINADPIPGFHRLAQPRQRSTAPNPVDAPNPIASYIWAFRTMLI